MLSWNVDAQKLRKYATAEKNQYQWDEQLQQGTLPSGVALR